MELWSLPVLDRELLRNCIRPEFILVSPAESFQHASALILEGAGGNLNAIFVIICLLNSLLRQLMNCSKEAPFLAQRDLPATPLTDSVQWLLMRCQLIPFTRDWAGLEYDLEIQESVLTGWALEPSSSQGLVHNNCCRKRHSRTVSCLGPSAPCPPWHFEVVFSPEGILFLFCHQWGCFETTLETTPRF